MTNKIFALCLAFLITSYSAITAAHTNELSPKQRITNVLMTQQKAWNSGDLEAFMQGYWQSDKLRFASGNTFRFGWKNTLENYQKGYPDRATMGKLAFDIIDIKLIDDNNAMVFGRWKLTREKDTPQGLFTLTFEKFNQHWLITQDHTSSK